MRRHQLLRLPIAAVWLANGLYAKLLGAVPRHEAIVARFFGTGPAHWMTPLIGLAEIGTGIWVLSGRHRRLCAGLQIGVVAVMNTLEAAYARDLLLWGGWNALWAALFCVFAAYWGFSRNPEPSAHAVVLS